ncbi:MAG: EAL domain-containing protein [Lachnospiraceae bacterium]|nr:EAL domain-containing protein [Lachnospiraceae bacterium]
MAARKRIALLMAQADENYQEKFIRGFLRPLFAEDFDVCIFSMYIKYQDTTTREVGESNIYSLVNYSLFDAVVLLSDTIQTPGVLQALEEKIHECYTGPVLVVDARSTYFPSIWTDSYTPFRSLVDHLIEVHGYKDIAFLSGRRWHPHSRQRQKAYEDALAAHGIPLREEKVFYGDFWYTSGSGCAENLLREGSSLPEVVICANDQMAIGLARTLEENGVNIPEDIAVVGFDSIEEGRTSPCPISSAYIPAASTGQHAAHSILQLMRGEEISDPDTTVELFIGGSCGCDAEKVRYRDILRKSWASGQSDGTYLSLHNKMQENIMIQTRLHGGIDVIYDNLSQIKGYKSFHICLCEQWATPAALSRGMLSSHGYPEHMLHALASFGDDPTRDVIDLQDSFDTVDLLPDLHKEREEPAAYIFTPLHFEDSCFGYAVVDYGSRIRSYDETYRMWMQGLMRALESLRRTCIVQERHGNTLPDVSSETDISSEELRMMKEVGSILDENRLHYYYQPIVSAVDGSIFAFEALMRAKSDMKVSPLQIISFAAKLKRLADVEKATFLNVLEQMETEGDAFGEAHIFINSIPGTRLDEMDYRRIEEMLKKRGSKAVVELTEQTELDDNELADMKDRFARMGIDTAVDDYGTGYSNVSNLLRYMPNYVKIDRSLLSGIQDSPQKQHFVREIINFSHDNGIQVLAEGVETGEELRTVIILGCDLIQGYYTGRPAPEVIRSIDGAIIEEICRYQKERQDGGLRRVFVSGKTNRFSATGLSREGYTEIESRPGEGTFRDYTLSGALGQKADLRLVICEGYEGQITLEHVHLNSPKQLPLIELKPGAKLTLVLTGDNILSGGGIHVPVGAELTLRGEGDLNIKLNSDDYFGIGCLSGAAGKLEFYQNGAVSIEARGNRGVGIGGETAASILIHRGRFLLQQIGGIAVGIGCMEGDVELDVHDCELDMTYTAGECCGLGSYAGCAGIDMRKVFLHCFGSADALVVAGSIRGDKAEVRYHEMGTNIDVRAEQASGAGTLKGESSVILDNVSYRFSATGKEAYAYGGCNNAGGLIAMNSNISVRIRNENGRIAAWQDNYMSYTDCRGDLTLNGKVYNGFD